MIKPNDVCRRTLKQLIGDTEQGMKQYEVISNLVKGALFSCYPGRRRRDRELLSSTKMLGSNVTLETEEEDGIVYAYLAFDTEKGRTPYILVGTYSEDDPILEIVPTDDERKEWEKEE